ncbi:type II secretion system protein GspL [Paraferrimonas haliotis]|uniref:MSHA biogenesis protein MshI1 n=1 Tax=Paraferrimonas haliotis TaxID=2013866 RepID=A0AA37TJF1_9GAMM|nr:type II secretion system protein GspL [Paraferrimonas haliotis]GLS82334.1 MSHA biogenesis protein MshI1 [Paraferrimonas haliotis]
MDKALLQKLKFWERSGPTQQAGLFLSDDHLTGYLAPTTDAPQIVEQVQVVDQDFQPAFAALRERMGKVEAALVLAPPHYEVVTVERPNVPNDELHQSLLWLIKDLVQLDVSDIHYDYFIPPETVSNKINVVVVSRSWLQRLLLDAKAQSITISHILVEEIALSNLFSGDETAKLLLSQHTGHELLLTVIKQGELYMQRRLRGFEQQLQISGETVAAETAQRLTLEIQRSMDFFEAQSRLSAVSSIELLLDDNGDVLQPLLSQNFSQPVKQVANDNVSQAMAKMALMELQREGLS